MKRLAQTINELRSNFEAMASSIKKWPVQISFIEGYTDRSDNQNKTVHMHFAEAAKHFGWAPQYAKNYAKYHYGLPILAARTDKHNLPTKDAIYWSNLRERLETWPYEERIEFMEKIPVTSEMSTKECALFIDNYMIEWTMEGCSLTDPSEIDPEWYKGIEKEMRSRGQI